ncbi:MAG: rRNA pseudouridine synthase [Clostridia bacterium]|nr:rRNA pseudouridine synthase [Clostridia bacterium]
MKQQDVRLQKFLADCGVASRRKAEEMIESGAVRVNGQTVPLGTKINPDTDKVTVHGKRVVQKKGNTYVMLHKPRGFVTTMSDEMGRKCVAELVENVEARVYPIGRLDRESEGLLLMTDDGAFAQMLMHPSRHIGKTYRVTVRPSVNEDQIAALSTGMMIEGYRTAPADVRIVTREPERVVLEIVLYEGRNRQIRKMCEALGLEVARLKRTAIGNVKLGMLKPGDWRMLSEKEVASLNALAKSSLTKE